MILKLLLLLLEIYILVYNGNIFLQVKLDFYFDGFMLRSFSFTFSYSMYLTVVFIKLNLVNDSQSSCGDEVHVFMCS